MTTLTELRQYEEKGFEVLKELIEQDKIERKDRSPRKWGVPEVAEMLGRSEKWLRSNSDHIEISGNGRRYYTLEEIAEIRENNDLVFKKPEGSKAVIKTVINFKGGVGKSTTTLHEAHYMATYKGMKVLIIDMDPQGSSTFCIGSMIPDVDVKEEDTILKAMTHNPTDCADIFISSYIPGVDFVPSGLAMQALEGKLLTSTEEDNERLGSPHARLANILSLVDEYYDLILIDCPPAMGMVSSNAMFASSHILVPIPPSLYDVGSAVMLNSTIADYLEVIGREEIEHRILITKDGQTATSKRNESKVRAVFSDSVYTNTVIQTTEFDKASESFTTVYDINRNLTSKKTYERAIECLNEVHEEIYQDYLKAFEQA